MEAAGQEVDKDTCVSADGSCSPKRLIRHPIIKMVVVVVADGYVSRKSVNGQRPFAVSGQLRLGSRPSILPAAAVNYPMVQAYNRKQSGIS